MFRAGRVGTIHEKWLAAGPTYGAVKQGLTRENDMVKLRGNTRTVRHMSDDEKITKLRAAAEDGNAKAALTLGECYMKGEEVPRDEQEAVRWFMRAAQLKDRWEQELRAESGEEKKSSSKRGRRALLALVVLAVLGGGAAVAWRYVAPGWFYDEAQQQLAQNHREQAVEYLTRSAELGDVRAQLALGQAYEDGSGIPRNPASAAEWYAKAAEQGDATAQYKMAQLLSAGAGVPRDMKRALDYLKAAAEKGVADAQSELGLQYLSGSWEKRDARQAVRWLTSAAAQGVAVAQHALYRCYWDGEGVERNEVEAVNWLRAAAQDGSDAGQQGRRTGGQHD